MPMYKPRTVEQFKVMEYIKEHVQTNGFLISPVSRSGLMIEDSTGKCLAFQWVDGSVLEAPLPVPATQEEHRAFVAAFHADPAHPCLSSLDELTDWWLNHPSPLTYRQALNLPEELYRRYLTCDHLLDLDDVLTLVMSGSVTDEEYLDMRLWFRNGHSGGNWLGPVGIDSRGERHELVFNWMTSAEIRYPFYLEHGDK